MRRMLWIDAVQLLVWAIYLASFWLPACDRVASPSAPPGMALTGWEAFRVSVLLVHPIQLLVDFRGLVIVPAVVVMNALMFMAPPLDISLRGRLSFAAPLYLLGAVGAALLPGDILGHVFIGYWTWVASMLAMFFVTSWRLYLLSW